MVHKHKGDWPYHEDPHGNWIACHSNPCKLHSGGDIMATSPEDAMAKADRLAHPAGGGGYAGGKSEAADKGAAEAHEIVSARKARSARIDEAMKSFYKPPISELPKEFKDLAGPGSEYTIGGKYFQTMNLPEKEVASLIRHDIARLKDAGGIPRSWRVSVRVDRHPQGWGNDFHITATRPAGAIPAHRRIRPSDVYDPNHEGAANKQLQKDMKAWTGISDCTYEQAEEYCRDNPGRRVATDEAREAIKRLNQVTGQYSCNAKLKTTPLTAGHADTDSPNVEPMQAKEIYVIHHTSNEVEDIQDKDILNEL